MEGSTMDKNVADMTERELLEELVSFTRDAKVQIASAAESLKGNPMLKMLPGLGGLFGGK